MSETADGCSTADIFVESGEAAFRALEKAAVAAAPGEHAAPTLGGGAVLDPDTRALLADHRVVFLRVGLGRRRQAGRARDRQAAPPRQRAGLIKALLDERLIYESVATLVVDTDGRSPQQVADEVAARLGEVTA
ncbi:MAG: shikimate kinase [Nocardioides sp.]